MSEVVTMSAVMILGVLRKTRPDQPSALYLPSVCRRSSSENTGLKSCTFCTVLDSAVFVAKCRSKVFFSPLGLCGLVFIACVLELHCFMIESVSSLPSI